MALDRRFAAGLGAGFALALAVVGLMAAGRLAQNPDKVLAAVLAEGAPVDARVARMAPMVRRNLLCAAVTILMEARGEPDAGQVAVGWVVRTRAFERSLDACGVSFEQGQFEWASYPMRRIVAAVTGNGETFLEAQGHAWSVLVEDAADPTRGANHFWGHKVIRPPVWSRRAAPGSRTVIGGHTFIRIPHRRAPWVERAFASRPAP